MARRTNAAMERRINAVAEIGEKTLRSRREKIGKIISELCDEEGDGPLHNAARLGQAEICEYLIKNLMLDVNLIAQSGKTPLCYAANFGDPNAIESLINCGADFNVKDANGLSPLHDAVIGDNPRAIEVLLSKGAQVDVQNFTGSPLLLATLHGHISCMKVLLAHNADAGADVNKIPVLSLAYHSKELMEYLLESGADPNLPDESGRLPIEVAAMRGKIEFVEILFPVTSPIAMVPDWSIKGLLSHVTSEKYEIEAIEEDPENASVYYAKRCLCWMHLGNVACKMTGFKYMVNANIDADSSKMSEVIHTLGMEHFSEMISFQMLLKLSLA
ncbi:ankyrin repeat protein [Carex littledalei]|uniref:Ankyrin repeat protein n=1 Tax=Carex littledalei TaxID=544730 RepID=A0A833QBZ7_9POAL|nr:ankyrin repeat protein [Carex littledalei]